MVLPGMKALEKRSCENIGGHRLLNRRINGPTGGTARRGHPLARGLDAVLGYFRTQEYQDSVLPPDMTARVAVEEASTLGWERYVGSSGRIIGMKTFGASAPLKELQRKFGFEPERRRARTRLSRRRVHVGVDDQA
jgi:hypothetical protein